MIVQANDIARPSLLDSSALVGLEGDGVGNLDRLADAHVTHLHALLVAARTDTQEGDAVAVRRVHVRLDLEDEAGEPILGRRNNALAGGARARRRRVLDEGVEQFLDTEVVDR